MWLFEPACKPLQDLAKIAVFFMALNVNLMLLLLFGWFKKRQTKTEKQQQKNPKPQNQTNCKVVDSFSTSEAAY